MAGVKGKSGGARAGAGRKKRPIEKIALETDDPLKFLLGVMQDATQDARLRVRAAVAAAQYTHTKKGDGGKKEEQAAKARKAETGRFAPPVSPGPLN